LSAPWDARVSGFIVSPDRVDVVWVFLPLLGAFIAHAPVLRFGLLRALARPIDGGSTIHAHRVFGGSKTWRGAIVMTRAVAALTCALVQFAAYSTRLPVEHPARRTLIFGALLGLGAVFGKLPSSFLKRQLESTQVLSDFRSSEFSL